MQRLRQTMTGLIGVLALTAEPALAGGFRLLELDGLLLKWGAPVLGTGAEVSYGFVTGPVQFPDALNCRSMVPIAGGKAESLAAVAADAFALWHAAANVDFRPAAAGETPDILIGAQAEPDHIAFANVWPDHAGAVDGVAPLERATICLNPTLVRTPEPAMTHEADLGTVLAHEIGHTLGLDHPGATGALMGYRDQGDIDALMAGDIAGIVALYGPVTD